MTRLLAIAFVVVSTACASASQAPTTTTSTQVQTPATNPLAMYAGTYALEAPSRTIELRVWIGDDKKLRGQLTGLSQETTFRPGGEHKFLHATSDDIWFLFTVEDGRATAAMMHQRGRVISGPRIR